jgi:bifunctional non-homologous end joining protein LigD
VILATDDLFAAPAPRGDASLRVGRLRVKVTTLERVYFPGTGQTKADLLRYYHRIAPVLLPHLRDRPMILRRFPEGAGGPSFYQHEAGDVPGFVRTRRVEAESGRELDYVVGGDEATLLYFAARGAIECHTWHSRIDLPDRPDRLVLDLDPAPGVPFDILCRIALTIRDVLDAHGLAGYAKTSGSRGLHVVVPLARRTTYERVGTAAHRLAKAVASHHPRETTLVRDPDGRPAGTVYVDFLQNARAKSIVAPYSVRARPTAPVSTPLAWEEVEACPDPAAFTMGTVPARIERLGELWADVFTARQVLPRTLSGR